MMEHLLMLRSKVNWEPLREPVGFIRALVLLLIIIAFASACNFKVDTTYKSNMTVCETVGIKFGYPFPLDVDVKVPNNSCDASSLLNKNLFKSSYVSQSQFFVCVGVLSFLFNILSVIFYVFCWDLYRSEPKVPLVDFGLTVLLTFFWFCASCAWAAAVTRLRQDTNKGSIETKLAVLDFACAAPGHCNIADSWGYGGPVISVLAGFGCTLVFGANIWFVFKETNLRKAPEEPKPQPPPHQSVETPQSLGF